MMKPKELAELKALAGSNLEAALMAAVRLGATKSADAAKPIKRAADILESHAEDLKFAFDEDFTDEAKQDYDEFKKVAKLLRGLLR